MNLSNIIISDPEILNGTPVFKGTRVPVKNLFDYLEAGDSLNKFIEDFDYIPKKSAIAVLRLKRYLHFQYLKKPLVIACPNQEGFRKKFLI